MRRRLKGPVPLRSVLDDTLRRLGLEAKVKQHQAFSLWSEVVGPKICHHAQPTHVRAGRLFVAVEDSMWLHQLNFLKHQILIELNRRLQKAGLCEIILRVGEVRTLPGPSPKTDRSPTRLPQPLGPREEERVRALLDPIKDPGCQEVVGRLLARFYCSKSAQENNNPLNK
ncbi:MAG: DUF721 domain-containing protein [candidate division NC10 bacterium]|nr:DUF721 domain-containing protein [candidate division NC10 bacterium]